MDVLYLGNGVDFCLFVLRVFFFFVVYGRELVIENDIFNFLIVIWFFDGFG